MRNLILNLAAGFSAIAFAGSVWGQISQFAMGAGEGGEAKATLTINADGSARFTHESTQSRQLAEQTVRMMEQYRNRADGDDSDEPATPVKPANKAEAKPYTDDELRTKLRESVEKAEESFGVDRGKLEKLEVEKDRIRMTTAQSFANLEELQTASYTVWGQLGMSIENVRFEKDAENHLKITATPQKVPKRFASQIAKYWKASKAKSEFHVVLPGKILSSSLPETSGNSTSFVIDSAKPETLDAMAKLTSEPVVIVAELGGLKIDKPIEGNSIQQRMMGMRDNTASNIPITEGGEGFTAEASSVTTTTTYEFPDAVKKEAGWNIVTGDEQEGTTVRTKIFGPKDRTLQSVSEIRVVKAVDDKGREVKAASNTGFANVQEGFDYTPGAKKPVNSKQVSVRLGLPAPDAKSIEEVTLQAVVQSVGTWKEMTIPLEDGKTNEIDLEQVLPGAKLTIKKASFKSMQAMVDGNVKGPEGIQQLDFQIKAEGNPDSFHMQPDYNQWNRSRDKTSRKVTLRGYMIPQGPTGLGGGAPKSMTLLVRFPTDTKRQRIEFKLTGLDLF